MVFMNGVTYAEVWRSHVEMPHLKRETRHPHSGDAVSLREIFKSWDM
jgi:hypothetical protein